MRALGLTGAKYNQKLALKTAKSKYFLIFKPVMQELHNFGVRQDKQITSSSNKFLGLTFLNNFKNEAKNKEINQKALESFSSSISKLIYIFPSNH